MQKDNLHLFAVEKYIKVVYNIYKIDHLQQKRRGKRQIITVTETSCMLLFLKCENFDEKIFNYDIRLSGRCDIITV